MLCHALSCSGLSPYNAGVAIMDHARCFVIDYAAVSWWRMSFLVSRCCFVVLRHCLLTCSVTMFWLSRCFRNVLVLCGRFCNVVDSAGMLWLNRGNLSRSARKYSVVTSGFALLRVRVWSCMLWCQSDLAPDIRGSLENATVPGCSPFMLNCCRNPCLLRLAAPRQGRSLRCMGRVGIRLHFL